MARLSISVVPWPRLTVLSFTMRKARQETVVFAGCRHIGYVIERLIQQFLAALAPRARLAPVDKVRPFIACQSAGLESGDKVDISRLRHALGKPVVFGDIAAYAGTRIAVWAGCLVFCFGRHLHLAKTRKQSVIAAVAWRCRRAALMCLEPA